MEKIYFADDQHELNYKRLLLKWNQAKRDTEYQTACYILAIPMIFEKVENDIGRFEYPISWMWSYLEWQGEYNEDWETYSRYHDDLHPEHDAWLDRKPFDLTGSMIHLGKLALNMWNGYEGFNLMKCLGTLDEKNYNIVKCAIDMRMGIFK